VTELQPYLDDIKTANDARNSTATVAACDAALAVIASEGEANITINGVNHKDSPDTELRDLWSTLWQKTLDLINFVRKANQPLMVPPALP